MPRLATRRSRREIEAGLADVFGETATPHKPPSEPHSETGKATPAIRREHHSKKAERNARPIFRPGDLAHDFEELVVRWFDARGVRPDYRRTVQAIKMFSRALPRRWNKEFIGTGGK